MTSNLGADSAEQVGFAESRVSTNTRYESAVREFFRPEFFNRLDGVVAFEPLTHEAILDITEMELRNIADREGLRKLGLQLTWTADVVEHLAGCGYNAKFGARPLQRTLETLIVAPLSRFLVQSRTKEFATLRLMLSTDRQTIVIEPFAEQSRELFVSHCSSERGVCGLFVATQLFNDGDQPAHTE